MAQTKKQKEQKQRRNKCSNCGSSFGYLRIKKGEWVCRDCGNVQKIKEVKKKDG